MSNSCNVPLFRGGSGTDCEEFIQSVYAYAFDKERAGDNKWISAFVATRFSGPALRWFARLSPDVKADWNTLQVALLDEYPTDCVENNINDDFPQSPQTVTESPPAAAWIPLSPDTAPTHDPVYLTPRLATEGFLARVQLRATNGSFRGWLADELRHRAGNEITETVSEALQVRVDKTSHHLFMADGNDGSRLGIRWRDPSPSLGHGSQSFARLLPLDQSESPVPRTLGFYMKGEYRANVWTIDGSGRLIITWRSMSLNEIRLYLAVNSGGHLYLTVDIASYLQRFPKEAEVELVCEPIQ